MHTSDTLKLINYCYYVKVILKHYVDELLMETGMKRKPGSHSSNCSDNFPCGFGTKGLNSTTDPSAHSWGSTAADLSTSALCWVPP